MSDDLFGPPALRKRVRNLRGALALGVNPTPEFQAATADDLERAAGALEKLGILVADQLRREFPDASDDELAAKLRALL